MWCPAAEGAGLIDARQRRTREALASAILRLAESVPVGELTMTRIARAAAVHRSTVYQYAGTPAELLRIALGAELDRVRAQYVTGADPISVEQAVTRATLGVFRHVADHAGIYARELDSDGVNLRAMLGEHFATSALEFVEEGALEVPLRLRGIDGPAVATRFVADGVVGAIAVWLRGERQDPEELLEAVRLLFPPWWPGARS